MVDAVDDDDDGSVFPESPRWLASKGRYAEAQKVIDQMAKANGVTVSPKLRSDAFNGLDNSEEKTSTEARVTPFQLFRHPRLMLRYSLLYSSWYASYSHTTVYSFNIK